jgi:hypothetical protein
VEKTQDAFLRLHFNNDYVTAHHSTIVTLQHIVQQWLRSSTSFNIGYVTAHHPTMFTFQHIIQQWLRSSKSFNNGYVPAHHSTMVTLQHIIQQWLRYSTQYLSVLPALNGSSNNSALMVTENVRLLLGLTKH